MLRNKREKHNFLKSRKIKNTHNHKHRVYDLNPKPKAMLHTKNQGSFFRRLISILIHQIKKLFNVIKAYILRNKQERLTVMFIPHNEDKIKNLNISNLALIITIVMAGLFTTFGSILIINHTSSKQEMHNLRISQKDSKIQFTKMREEIISLSGSHEKLKELLVKIGKLTRKKGQSGDEIFSGLGGLSISPNELDPKKIQELKDFDNKNSQNTRSSHSKENISEENIPYSIFILNRLLNETKDIDDHLDNLDGYIKRNLKSIRNSPTLWPVKGYIINPYGLVRKSDDLEASFNTGVDIASLPGAKVVATAPGYRKHIAREKNGLFTVTVRHHHGYETVYSGLAHLGVKKNAALRKGEEIGFLGSNNTQENILHYQIYIGIEAQNPLSYLTYPKE